MKTLSVLILACCAILAHAVPDTTQRRDTLNRPLPFHGAITGLGIVQPYQTLKRSDILTIPYRTLEDVLEWRTPSYVLSTGLIGDWNVPLLFGERPRDQRVVFDGIGAYSAVGLFPPAMVMPEFMEQLDIVTGADAAIIMGANSGTGYWVQQPWYDTRAPYTRVWYCQSAYDFIATDGVFSLNVAPNLNTTLGFRRMVTPGRYSNQWLDVWNTRMLVRWNLAPDWNVSLVHRFANWGLGTNGGVDPERSDDPSNERTAAVVYNTLDQRMFRHDVQLLATKQAGERRILSATVAMSNEEGNVYRPLWLSFGTDSNTHVRWISTILTLQMRWEERLDTSLAILGAIESAVGRTTASDYTAAQRVRQIGTYLYGRWEPMSNVIIRGGLRWMAGGAHLLPVAAIGMTTSFAGVTIRLDAVSSVRPASAVEGNVQPEYVRLLLLHARTGDSAVNAGLSAYVRQRRNAIVATPLVRGDTVITTVASNASSLRTESGITIESNVSLQRFCLAPMVVCSFLGSEGMPLLYGALSLRYTHRIGRNRLQAELFFRARTMVHAQRFIPHTWAYLATDQLLEAAVDGATLALSAELGNAVVKLAMGNVLSTYYATLSTFPQLDRHITLSVAWTFFD